MNEEFTHPFFSPDRVLHSQFFLENFSIQQKNIGMGFSLMSGEATNEGKLIPHESRMAHFYFLTNGLAGVMKKKFPTSGVAASGEFLFHHNC